MKSMRRMQTGQVQGRAYIFLRMFLFIPCLFFCLQTGVPAETTENVPVAVEAVLGKARILMEKNDLKEAIRILSSMEEKGEKHHLVSYTLGNCYMMTHGFQAANKVYLKSVEQHAGYGPAWFNLANSYMELDQMGLAGDAFVKAYETYEEKNPEALYYAASVYLAGDQPAKALEVVNRLMALHPDQVKTEWMETRVHILLANDREMEALPVMEQLIREIKGDKRKQWQEFLMQQYLSLKMEKKALALGEALTREEPGEPKWWKGLIHVNLALEQYSEALSVFDVYGRLFELSDEEKKLMADLYLMTGLPSPAIKILAELLSRSHDTDLVEKIARGYAAISQPKGALPWIEEALKKNPGDPGLLMVKGETLFNTGDYPEAVKALKASVDQDKTPGRAWLLMGYAAWYGNDIPTAISAMKKAAKFSGQKKAAEEVLHELKLVSRGEAEGAEKP